MLRRLPSAEAAADGRAVAAVAVSLALAAGAVACGEEGPNARNGDASRGTVQITWTDLAAMVLPQGELGREFAAFEEAPVSGPMPNHRAATETFADDTGVDLAEKGRHDGYRKVFWIRAETPLPAKGVVSGGTYVELFESEEAAGDYVDDRIEEFERAQGEV